MARIRSLHPGFFTDEDVVELSLGARLLLLGLGIEADDKGIFPWKPKTIKMKVFPADVIKVDPLLDELVRHNLIAQFSHRNRTYGAIRNFRKHQRPKYPNDIYPITKEIRAFVGLDDDPEPPDRTEIPEIAQDESCAIPTGAENTDQMEDVGGSKDSCAIVRFEEWWDFYPHRGGVKRNRKTASQKYARAVKAGVPEQLLIDRAKAYGVLCTKIDKLPRDPTTWLNHEGWTDEVAVLPQVDDEKVWQARAAAVKSGQSWRVKSMTSAQARELIRRGDVTEEECRKVGVS